MDLFLLMLILLNPFSQVLYLRELFERMTFGEFFRVHWRATIMSALILFVFVISGDFLLQQVFQIHLGSLRAFGGLVTLYVAYRIMSGGEGSNILFQGDIEDLAPHITLPYMVGPGMIWVAILMGRVYHFSEGLLMVVGVLAINMAVVLTFGAVFHSVGPDWRIRMTKYLAILMRVMAFFVGAVGVEMVFTGVQDVFGGDLALAPLEPAPEGLLMEEALK